MVAPRDRTGPTPKYSLILSPAVLAGRDEDLSTYFSACWQGCVP